MNNEPIQFVYYDVDLRTVMRDGEPWFVARDVCEILEIKNSRHAVASLDEDEKGVVKSDTLGGTQRLSVISESGLYTLIMRSNKPEAKRFRKWVTQVVLPTIRKTGFYQAQQPQTREQKLAELSRYSLEVIEEQKQEIEQLTYENEDLKDQIGEGKTWKRARSIPWLRDYFEKPKKAKKGKRGKNVYGALGKQLTTLSEQMGYEVGNVEDSNYPNGVGLYHVEVIAALKDMLDYNPSFMCKYRIDDMDNGDF